MRMAALVAELLKRERIPYVAFRHPPAYTAQEVAAAAHVPGQCWAKVVICIADGRPLQAVLPAHYAVDFEQLRILAGAAALRLASETEMADLYPECEVGAMAPFGMLYGHSMFVERALVGEPAMTFRAGTHTHALSMHYWDFAEVTQPVVGAFGVAPARGNDNITRVRKQRPNWRGETQTT